MPVKIFSFIGIFFTVYGLVHYYIGLRGWQAFNGACSLQPKSYWLMIMLIALIFPAGRFGETSLPFWFSNALTIIGSYWLAILYYLFFFVLLADLLRLLDHYVPFLPAAIKQAPAAGGIVLAAVALVVVYGYWNARHPVIRHYDITIPKATGQLKQIHAVMVSDIHLGKFVDSRRLEQLVEAINRQNPDLVLLAGDIIDENVDLFAEKQMPAVFQKLHPPLGTYAVMGNHEYIGRKLELAAQQLRQGNIVVLRDQECQVADSFYIIGRDDRAKERFSGEKRANLSTLTQNLDPALPFILLDHQPVALEEAEHNGIDLQLSGHTHLGQIFPNNLITHALYEVDWGYLRKNNLQIIVSCGFGTWGPPIRVGNRPEILDIMIHFKD